jgi:hypothetical protein
MKQDSVSIIPTITPPFLFRILLLIVMTIAAFIIWYSSLFILKGPEGLVRGKIAIPILIALILLFYNLFLRISKKKYKFKTDCIEIINYKMEKSFIYYNDILEARPINTFLSAISFSHLEIIHNSGLETHVTNIYFLDNPDYYRSIIFESRIDS